MGEIVTGEKGKSVIEAMLDHEWHTARDLSKVANCSKETVRLTVSPHVESEEVRRRVGEGDHGATLYRLSETIRPPDVLTHREKVLHEPCHFSIKAGGYIAARSELDGERESVLMHRLLAVSKYGFDAVAGRHVHHVDGIPWHNTPDNIELKLPSKHACDHWHDPSLGEKIGEASPSELATALECNGYTDLANQLS